VQVSGTSIEMDELLEFEKGNEKRMGYACLTQQSFEDCDGYRLVPIREEDMESIRLWRNAQIDVLRQKKEISPKAQQQYFQEIIFPLYKEPQPSQLLFSFFFHDTCIGYGGLTQVDWDAGRAEVAFLLDPIRVENQKMYSPDFFHFLSLLSQIAFQELHFHRLFTETFSFRRSHLAILEKFGFVLEGRLREHVYKHNQWHDSLLHGLLKREWNRAS
jgi:RimJ/RimL family protein N-acetyltransferase